MNPSFFSIRWHLFWTSLLALTFAVGCFSLAHWVYAPSHDRCIWTIEEISSSSTNSALVPKVFIRAIIPNGPVDLAGIKDGDELLAIHNLKITEPSDSLSFEENRATVFRDLMKMQSFINTAPDGAIVQFTVQRNGETIVRPVELQKVLDIVNALLLLTGLVAWGIGLMVVLSSPQRKVARHFYYLGILTLVMAAAYSMRGGNYTVPVGIDTATRICSLLFSGLMPPLWIHFFLRFPYGFEFRKYRFILAGLYIVSFLLQLPEAIAVVAAFVTSHDSDWALRLFLESLPIGATSSKMAPISSIFGLTLLGTGIALFCVGTFKLTRARRKAFLTPLSITVAIFLNMLTYLWLAKSYSGTPEWGFFYYSSHYFFLPLPLLPVTFAIAILRHGLFDVRRVIVRWLIYFLSLGTLVIAYLALLAWLFTILIPEKIPMSLLGGLMGLLALPLAWTLKWMLATLRKKFRRDVSSARGVIMNGLRNPKNRFSETAILESLVVSIHDTFRPQICHCLPIEWNSIRLPRQTKTSEIIKIDGQANEHDEEVPAFKLPIAMLRHARDSRELVFGLGHDESDWISAQGRALRQYLDTLGAQIMVLIMSGDQPHSILLLGGKYSELNYSREDRELMREVAIAAGIILESAAMHKGMIDKTRIDQELQAARNIQESLITSNPPDAPGYQIALRLVPALETGGDLLWVAQRSPDRWIAVVGDVSGKGLAAAIYMSQAMALLNYAIRRAESTLGGMLERMDNTLRGLMGSRDFLTLSAIEWCSDGQFKVVRAGHPPPIYLCNDTPSQAINITPSGTALAMRPASPLKWHIYEGTLRPGEWIAMYSDGITEAMDNNGALFGTERLTEQLKRFWATGSPRAACEAIFQQVAAFEDQNKDDRTLLILARKKQ